MFWVENELFMKVFKFGGASLKNASAIRNMLNIILHHKLQHQLLIVVSAMGKTTNALEAVLNNYWENKNYVANLRKVGDFHYEIIENLFPNPQSAVYEVLENWLENLQSLLKQSNQNISYDQMYDLIVGQGEVISSKIVQHFLLENSGVGKWINACEFIVTDSSWREGNVDWSATQIQIKEKLYPILQENIIVTQGFIGANPEGTPLTLGREGSDFSAAIFACCLEVDSLTIWKDVTGVLNADPKRYSEPVLYPQLSYLEASVMSKYGASVIHPKTIAPLARKNIRLNVKSFVSPKESGTCISNIPSSGTIPSLIYKEKQVLVRFKADNFSFIKEVELSIIFQWINQCHLKVNYLHKKATEVLICVDDFPRRIQKLSKLAAHEFKLNTQSQIELITIIHPQDSFKKKVLNKHKIILESHSDDLYQAIIFSIDN